MVRGSTEVLEASSSLAALMSRMKTWAPLASRALAMRRPMPGLLMHVCRNLESVFTSCCTSYNNDEAVDIEDVASNGDFLRGCHG